MRQKVLLWGFALSAICMGCSTSDKAVVKEIRLKGTDWGISEELYRPSGLNCNDKYLIMGNDDGETLYSLFELRIPHRTYPFGVKGQGPKELLSSRLLMVTDNHFETPIGVSHGWLLLFDA